MSFAAYWDHSRYQNLKPILERPKMSQWFSLSWVSLLRVSDGRCLPKTNYFESIKDLGIQLRREESDILSKVTSKMASNQNKIPYSFIRIGACVRERERDWTTDGKRKIDRGERRKKRERERDE